MQKKTGLIITGVVIFLIILLNNAPEEAHQLKCPQSPVKGVVGQSVTLDCHTEPQLDVTDKLVEWKFNSIQVFVHRSKGVSSKDQGEKFKDRASLDSSGILAKGKLALNISRVEKTDAGTYTCSVGRQQEKISCSTELIIVTEPEKKIGDANNAGTAAGIGITITIVVIGAAFAVVAE